MRDALTYAPEGSQAVESAASDDEKVGARCGGRECFNRLAGLERKPAPSYLQDFIYGAIDGALTTFAGVAGVEGASLDFVIILVAPT